MARKNVLSYDEFKRQREEEERQRAAQETQPAPAPAPAPAPQTTLDRTAGMLAAPSFEWVSGAPTDQSGNTLQPQLMATPQNTPDTVRSKLAQNAPDQSTVGAALETIRSGRILSYDEFRQAQQDYLKGKPQQTALDETASLLAGQPEQTPATETTPEKKEEPGAAAEPAAPKPGTAAFEQQQQEKQYLQAQRTALQTQLAGLIDNQMRLGKIGEEDYTAEDYARDYALAEEIEKQIAELDEEIKARQRDVNVVEAAGTTVMSGLQQAGLGVTKALDWLAGENSAPWFFVKEAAPMFGLDLEGKNPVSALRRRGENDVAYWHNRSAESVEGNDLWEKIQRHGESISASAPFVVLNLMTAGGAAAAGATTQGLEYLASLGEASSGFQALSTMAAQGIRTLAANPSAEYSFISTFGQSYYDAIEDGASPVEATLYAATNGAFNAMIEVGGADEALGGMQNVPKDVRDAMMAGDTSLLLKWVKEVGQEIGEEEFQGFMESGLKGIYQDVPVFSTEDENAIFNPQKMLQTAKDTAIDAGIMVGGNMALDRALSGTGRDAGIQTGTQRTAPATQTAVGAPAGAAAAAEGSSAGGTGTAAATPTANRTAQVRDAVNGEGAYTGLDPQQRLSWLKVLDPEGNWQLRDGELVQVSTETQGEAAGATGAADTETAAPDTEDALAQTVNTLTETGTAGGAAGAAEGTAAGAVGAAGTAAGNAETRTPTRVTPVIHGTNTPARTAGAAAGETTGAAGGAGAPAGAPTATHGTETAEETRNDTTEAPRELNSEETAEGGRTPGTGTRNESERTGEEALRNTEEQTDEGTGPVREAEEPTGQEVSEATETGESEQNTQSGLRNESDRTEQGELTNRSEEETTERETAKAEEPTGDVSQQNEGETGEPEDLRNAQEPTGETEDRTDTETGTEEETETRNELPEETGRETGKGTDTRTETETDTNTETETEARTGTETTPATVAGTELEGVMTDEEVEAVRSMAPTEQQVLALADARGLTAQQTRALADAVGIRLSPDATLRDGTRVMPTGSGTQTRTQTNEGGGSREAPGQGTVDPAGAEQTGTGGTGTDGQPGGRLNVTVPTPPANRGGKLSRYWTNTLRKMETKAGIPGESPLRTMSVSEAESLARGASLLKDDAQRTVEELTEATAWNGAQNDAAHIVLADLYRQGRKTGDWGAYRAWRKIVQAHISDTARGLQATAKHTKNGMDTAMEALDNLENNRNASQEEKAAAEDDITEAGEELTDIEESQDIDALRDLIEKLSRKRRTGTFVKGRFRKILNGIDDWDYLHGYAARQILALANDAGYKPDLGAAIKTWQVNAQLSRLTTFLRNIGGNVVFGLQDTLTQNGFAVALDHLAAKFTGQRTVGADRTWFSSTARKASRDAMLRSVLEVAGDIDMGISTNKYGTDAGGRTFKMSGGAFSRFMSRWEQLLGYSLSTSDRTSRGQIEQAVYEGIRAANPTIDEETARALAKEEADYRLFQNEGTARNISKGLHDLMNLAGVGGEVTKHGRQGGFGLGDLLNPYPGVPANLAVKALEYSPLNTIKGVTQFFRALNAAKKAGTGMDVATQHRAVMNAARGLAGAPLIIALTALFRTGLAKNTDDEDDPDALAQMRAEGRTGVQINLDAIDRALAGGSTEWQNGDDLMNIGFLEPLNAFLAIASMISDEGEDGDLSVWSLSKKYLGGAMQSVMEMPVLGNIQNAVNTFQYSEAEDLTGKLGDMAVSLAGDAASGMIPAPVGQLARTRDEVYRDVTADSELGTVINNLLNGIPGARETLPVKQDVFGNPKAYPDSELQRFLNNFVLPGSVTDLNQTPVSAETERIYNATGDARIYPDRNGPKSITAEGEKYPLTAAERQSVHKAYGQLCEESYAKLFGEAYDWLTDEQKVQAATSIKGYAMFAAKKDFMDTAHNIDLTNQTYDKMWEAVQGGADLVDLIVSKLGDGTAKLSSGITSGYVLREAGVPEDTAQTMLRAINTDKKNGITQGELFAYWQQHPLDEQYIQALWEQSGWDTGWDEYKAKKTKKK